MHSIFAGRQAAINLGFNQKKMIEEDQLWVLFPG